MKHANTSALPRLAALAMALVMLMASAVAEEVGSTTAQAETEPYVELSTPYPAMTVNAGDSLTLELALDNYSGASQTFALSVDECPEGWTTSLEASGQRVSRVHVRNGEVIEDVSLEVEVPLDTAEGEYSIVLGAEGEGYSDALEISLTVSAEELGQSSFEVEYPSQEGDSSTDFTFSATLINNTLNDQSYALSASAPTGWSVSFLPSGETTKVAALDLEARTTQGVDIEVTPPENVEAGTYEIPCTATTVSEKMSFTLSVTITGTYGLTLSTPSGLLSTDAVANQETAVQILLTNTGNTDLTNISLTSSTPDGWSVRYATEVVDLIEAGASVETTAYITPAESSISGDYATVLSATQSNVSDTVELRITVKTETTWGIVGVAVIVALLVIVALIMRKYGRR